MKLPGNALIARAKLTQYLLVPQRKGDKSKFLALAGYNLENAAQLEIDLRRQILTLPATPGLRNEFGQYF